MVTPGYEWRARIDLHALFAEGRLYAPYWSRGKLQLDAYFADLAACCGDGKATRAGKPMVWRSQLATTGSDT